MAFSGSGSGIEGDPYIITDVDQLQEMSNDLSSWFELGNDIDASETSSWNAGAGFVPVGLRLGGFTGNFNGREYVISDLFINRTTDYIGLFGYLDDVEIRNVGLEDVDITGDDNVGGLAGSSNDFNNIIENCYTTGSVTGTGGEVGGFAGKTVGITRKCFSSAAVIGGSFQVGGFVGFCTGGTISNCYATGSVDSESGFLGGFCGYNDDTIEDCYSIGAVGVGAGDETAGGFSGRAGVAETDCFWDTETSGKEASEGGTGKTTAQMKKEATFTNWDFSTVWDIVEDTSYPTLRSVPFSGTPQIRTSGRRKTHNIRRR